MERSMLDLWVGLFVCAGIGAVLVLALKVGNMSGFSAADTYKVYAEFDNIGGLKPRAPVKSAGVVVGRVSEVSFDNESFRARVTLHVDKRYKFPKDSSASILTSGLLGDQYVGLEAGVNDAALAPGATITQTQSALVLENLIGQFLFSKAADAGATAGSGAQK